MSSLRLPRASSVSWLLHLVIGLFVGLPLLRDGHFLALDLAFGPQVMVRWDASPQTYGIVNTAPLQSIIWLLRWTGPAAAFLLVAGLVFGAGYAMNRAIASVAPRVSLTARIVSGTLYAVNPFTYTRLVHGHVGLLAGMVLLPIVVIAFARLVATPSWDRVVVLGMAIAGLGFASFHVAGMLLLVAPVVVVLLGWPGIRPIALAAAVALVLSSWWIVQAVAHPPPSVTTEELDAFATVPHGLTSAGHVAALYGFWRVDEFPLPRDGVSAWPLTFAPIAGLVVAGLVLWWKERRASAVALSLIIVVGVLLACGSSFPPTSGIFRWLFNSVPGFALYREPQKWVVVVLLGYALLVAKSVDALLARIGTQPDGAQRRMHLVPILPVVALLGVVLFYGRTMILNFDALRPVSFPKDWESTDRVIRRHPSRVLVLPWHLYMTFPFARHRIANPAETFFGGRVVASDAIEIGSIRTQVDNPESKLVDRVLFEPGGHGRLPETMRRLCTRWLVLFKAADWTSYQWLDGAPNLRRVFDGPTIRLYEDPSVPCRAP